MLALLGFATIATFLALIMTKRMGIMASMAMDPHGKTLSYALLEMEI